MHTYDALVIGAGQAGLAAGYYLRLAGLDFTMIDAGDSIGASWRNRWDSLRLFTPSRYNALPGMPFPGPRYALPTKDEVADYLEGYARAFRLPVRLDSPVASLRGNGGRFETTTQDGLTLHSKAVIVATGANQRPHVPSFAPQLAKEIAQIHSSDYRRPGQLPPGKVLVVGAGNSGAQIALELAESGREVVLSGPDTGTLPRRVLGRDVYDWLWPTIMRPAVDSLFGRRLMGGRLFAGDPLIGMKTSALQRPGLSRVGRMASSRDGLPVLDDGSAIHEVAATVWCTGFRPDYDWIELPALGLDGYPAHRYGVAEHVRALGFLGMRFQRRMGSSLLGGVGEDAEYVVNQLIAQLRATERKSWNTPLESPSRSSPSPSPGSSASIATAPSTRP